MYVSICSLESRNSQGGLLFAVQDRTFSILERLAVHKRFEHYKTLRIYHCFLYADQEFVAPLDLNIRFVGLYMFLEGVFWFSR
jgi:hypothetical protein